MLRVLLIDDNPDDRTLVVRQLKREFNEIEIEQIIDQSGLDEALSANRFDIAITDYQLIWSNGLTVLHQLKSVCPLCPVIMFTNSTTQEEAIEAMKAGLDDYIVKSPQHYIRLSSAVRLALERVADRQKANQLEMRLQELLSHLQVGVFRATLRGHLVEANPVFLQLLGVQTLAEAQALNLQELFLHPQVQLSEQSESSECQPSSLPSLPLAEQWLRREVQVRSIHGHTVWVALNQTITARGRDLFVEGLVEDIRDRKALEDALQQQAKALAQTHRLKDEFLSTLYHELRTPLNAILGWSKLLRTQPTYDIAVLSQALAVIERNAEKQTQIIEDILDVSQIIQGQLQLNPTFVHMEEILTAVLAKLHPAIAAKSLEFSLHVDPHVELLWGDKERLQQILWNLLLNAVKFTPNAKRVEVRLEQVDRSVQFQVKDTGVGINPEFLPYVFDRFSQADGSISRAYGGLGLGLAIVRHLVELHGGTVRAESLGLGQGATFTIQIPLMTTQSSPIHLAPRTGNAI
ncbi:MAG: ATP-binding protein [Leptolyngbya sp. Prado105]|jgi:PAS domain S-box-containing protein|nr:ATP-binding protein [Leptolyngbya sp. Prado105]